MGRTLLGAAVALGVAAMIAGCGSSSTKSAPKASAQAPASSIRLAADTSSAAAGYRVDLTEQVVSGATTLDATATGSYSPAAREAAVTMSVKLPSSEGGTSQIQLVLDRGTIYLQLPPKLASEIPGGKPWLSIDLAQIGKLSGVSGFGSLVNDSSSVDDPTQYLDFLRAVADGSVKDLGPQTVNGVQTTHYQAEVDFSKLPNAVPAADRQAAQELVDEFQKRANVPDFPVDVWIDSSNLIRRLQENMTETVSGKSFALAITENYLSYGPQPAPTVPSPDQTLNLFSLLHSS